MPGEVLKLSIQEALVTMFTDDPVNWLKWAVVFAILIGGYAVAVPLYKKVFHGVSWERKRDIAKSKDHVIKAALADKHPTGGHGRKFCVSNFRQTQEYYSYDVHNRANTHCSPLSPSGWNGMRAGTA